MMMMMMGEQQRQRETISTDLHTPPLYTPEKNDNAYV